MVIAQVFVRPDRRSIKFLLQIVFFGLNFQKVDDPLDGCVWQEWLAGWSQTKTRSLDYVVWLTEKSSLADNKLSDESCSAEG